MKTLTVAYYTALRNLKDIRMLIIVVLLPIGLIAILGNALNGFFEPQKIEVSKVAYFNADGGLAGAQLSAFLESAEVQKFISLLPVASLIEGQTALDKGEVEAVVHVPAWFSTNLTEGEPASITVLTPLKSPLVIGFLTSYANSVNSMHIVTTMGQLPTLTYHDYVKDSAISTAGRRPRAMDYYAVQTLLQVMLMGGWYGIGSILDDKEKNTVVRMRTAPITPGQELLGKVLANVLVLLLQTTIVMLFSKYVYGANWSGNAMVIATTLFLFSVISVGLGLLMASVIKNSNQAIGALWGTMLFCSIVAGAFGATDMGLWARFSPNYYAKTALFTTIYGGSSSTIQASLIVMFLLSLALLSATIVFRRRQPA